MLLGGSAMERLRAARVCVAGLGAVGGYVVEGLARAGVGSFRLVDFDTIQEPNINRQLCALHSTLGRLKVEAARERILDINPDARVDARPVFADRETMPGLLSDMDLLVDAIDSLTPKVDILQASVLAGVPAYSALGAATRLDADAIRFGPLFAAAGCPLGRLVRKRLRRRGIAAGDLWCVFSNEERNLAALRDPEPEADDGEYRRGRRRKVLGSLPALTGLFGLRLAHEATLRLAKP